MNKVLLLPSKGTTNVLLLIYYHYLDKYFEVKIKVTH